MAYVYRHIRLDKNQVFYVGIGEDIPKYAGRYYRSTQKACRTKWWKHITDKTPYKVEIMLDNLTWEEACEKEKEFIKLYGRANLGTGTLVNLTDGGEGSKGLVMTPESRVRVGLSSKGRKHTEETKRYISSLTKGIKRSREFGEKVSKGKMGKKKSVPTHGIEVLNMETGVYYISVPEAAKAHNINSSILAQYLAGTRKNKTSMARTDKL